jgi:hypothetical protein
MGHPLTDTTFRQLMNANLDKVVDDTTKRKDLEGMINKIFNVQTINSDDIQHMSVSGIPDVTEFNGSLTTVDVHPGFTTRIEPTVFAHQVQTQRTLMDNKKFKALSNHERGNINAAFRTAEKKAVRIFANSTSAAFDFQISEEGVSLASSSHSTKVPGISTTTGFNNVGTSPMSGTAVSATRVLMRRFKQDNGERFEMGDQYGLVYPDNLHDTALEINGTPNGLGTANGNINPNQGRFTLFPYLRLDDSSTTTWHMVNVSAMKESLMFIWRNRPETNRVVDWSTYNLMQSVYTSFGAGYFDWRWIFTHVV